MRRSANPGPLTIGRLAELTGVHIETIRYYEKIGMLAKPDRSAGGYRQYSPVHVSSLYFIRRGRELGFTLEAIRDLIRLNEGGACCEKARDVTIGNCSPPPWASGRGWGGPRYRDAAGEPGASDRLGVIAGTRAS